MCHCLLGRHFGLKQFLAGAPEASGRHTFRLGGRRDILLSEKYHFGVVEVKFLGHIINGANISPDPEKLSAVKEWPVPTSVKEVSQLLGFTNYFRRFRDYSTMSQPLEELTGKYALFCWDSPQQQASCKLQNALLNAPVLGLANLSRQFGVFSEASDQAIGAVLLQTDDHGDWHPIALAGV